MAWDHRVDEFDSDMLYEAFWLWLEKKRPPLCTSGRNCKQVAEFRCSYQYETGRARRVTVATRWACRHHAERFAKKHGTELSPDLRGGAQMFELYEALVRGRLGQLSASERDDLVHRSANPRLVELKLLLDRPGALEWDGKPGRTRLGQSCVTVLRIEEGVVIP